ncbi:transcriptional regulator, partial [Subtercola sp. Z020]|uniref:helix-turn-helix transcriptional regulator n=1 Tax=Subtercola sp. Z020 TaxID=2080582 RepID=UPI000CE8435E
MNRAGLADFLRRRREALHPADVGLPPGARRRTAGLRREEVAALSGMSTDYYARMEQQRGPQPSEQMLGAIARGLRLTLDERDHLFRLAGHTPPRRLRRTDHVSPALLRVLDRLDDSPALVLSDLGETLAQNRLAVALLGDHSGFTGPAQSGFYRWFTDPRERARYPERDHARQSSIQAAGLRAAISAGGGASVSP